MEHLRPGGVFGLWSALEPSKDFIPLLSSASATVSSHEVSFFNPHLSETVSNRVGLGLVAKR